MVRFKIILTSSKKLVSTFKQGFNEGNIYKLHFSRQFLMAFEDIINRNHDEIVKRVGNVTRSRRFEFWKKDGVQSYQTVLISEGSGGKIGSIGVVAKSKLSRKK
jgi:hypothetical protein